MGLRRFNLKIKMTTRNFVAQFTNNLLSKDLEPVTGDITKCGLIVTNSELNDLDASGGLFLLRLVCTNGCVLTENWGKVTRNKNNKLKYDSIVNKFTADCRQLDTNRHMLTTTYNKLPDVSLNSEEFVKVFKGLSALIGKDGAMELLDSSIDEIKEFAIFEQLRKKVVSSSQYGRKSRDTEKNAYTVFNKITECARDLGSLQDSHKLQAYSGKYLWLLSNNLVETADTEVASV